MKFQPDRLAGTNVVSRQEAGRVWINADAWSRSVLVPWQGAVQPWPPMRLDQLTTEHFGQLLSLEPQLVIFGSGARLRFVHPALQRPLIERGIGIETMDTAAACRTFNVLAAEGRKVAAALLVETAP